MWIYVDESPLIAWWIFPLRFFVNVKTRPGNFYRMFHCHLHCQRVDLLIVPAVNDLTHLFMISMAMYRWLKYVNQCEMYHLIIQYAIFMIWLFEKFGNGPFLQKRRESQIETSVATDDTQVKNLCLTKQLAVTGTFDVPTTSSNSPRFLFFLGLHGTTVVQFSHVSYHLFHISIGISGS